MLPVAARALTIVIPVRDEQGNIGRLLDELSTVLVKACISALAIVVDDHSSDNTRNEVLGFSRSPTARKYLPTILMESAGQGKDAALKTGLLCVESAIAATMDGDGQNSPADLPRLLLHLSQSQLDMICGVRSERRDSVATCAVSLIANSMRKRLTHSLLDDAGCALRIMRKPCIRIAVRYDSLLLGCSHYFHPTLAALHGFRVGQISVNHKPRTLGASKFPLVSGRMVSGLRACLVVNTIRSRRMGRYRATCPSCSSSYCRLH